MAEGFKNKIEKLVTSTKGGVRASNFEKDLSEATKSSDLAGLHDSAGQIAGAVGKRKSLIEGNRYDGPARDADFLAITRDAKLADRDKKNIRELLDGLGHRKSLLANKKETPKPKISVKVQAKEKKRMPYNFGANRGVNSAIGAGGGIQPVSRPNAPRLVV